MRKTSNTATAGERPETFTLRLEHVPNPDIGDSDGYWQPPVTARKTTVEVKNLADARSTFESWRDANGLGGGNMARHCGEIRRKTGQLVGRFSYNGRFWNPEGKEVIIVTAEVSEVPVCSCTNTELERSGGKHLASCNG